MLFNLSLAMSLLTSGAAASGVTALERGAIPLSAPDVLSRRYVDITSGHYLVRRQRPEFESCLLYTSDAADD